jgi:hypothetical protein
LVKDIGSDFVCGQRKLSASKTSEIEKPRVRPYLKAVSFRQTHGFIQDFGVTGVKPARDVDRGHVREKPLILS